MRLKKKSNILIHTAVVVAMLTVMMQPAASFGSDNKIGVAATRADEFKVIGYYCGEWFDVPVEKLQADKLTHIMYGFLIPKEDGTCKPFEEPEELAKLIEKCHSVGTKVYVSVGGYREKDGTPLFPVFEKIAADDQLREKFVNNIMDIVKQYGFDGVEMDWEYPKYTSSADYEKTMVQLSERLKPLGKGLSTALPGTGSTDGQNVWEALAGVTDKTIECFDFISLMCYDLSTDPNHSPISYANTTINYWKNFRNVPAEKLILGMPLYARPSWQQYRFLVEMDKENAYTDYADTEPLKSTYNGLNTLREKTMISIRKAGGVMLFDVNEDTYDDTSVVSMIDDTLAMMDGLSKEEINNYISVVIDNKPLSFTLKDGMGMPFIDENNRTLVPVRKLLESIGAEVSYTADARGKIVSVGADLDGTHVNITIDSNKYSVNENNLTMDTAAVIKDGRTYIPARAVLEAFDYTMTYSVVGKTVYATSNHIGQTATQEVTVGTAEEFVKAIGSNKKIILKPGEYDLSGLKQVNSSDNTVVWESVQDGHELIIQNISNLTIEGAAEGTTKIIVSPRYAQIMNFKNSSNITIKNITAGHTPMGYECDAGVLLFDGCQDIAISNSELYGCGSIGLKINNTTNLNCDNVNINHCSLRALDIYYSKNITFSNSKIQNHEAYSNIVYVVDSEDITFKGCDMTNNNCFEWGFMELSGKSNVLIDICNITNNTQATDSDWGNAYFFKVTDEIRGGNSTIIVKNTKISGNRCDFLTDKKDAVTFENCTIKDNVWK